jgi:hypothetical protein
MHIGNIGVVGGALTKELKRSLHCSNVVRATPTPPPPRDLDHGAPSVTYHFTYRHINSCAYHMSIIHLLAFDG